MQNRLPLSIALTSHPTRWSTKLRAVAQPEEEGVVVWPFEFLLAQQTAPEFSLHFQ